MLNEHFREDHPLPPLSCLLRKSYKIIEAAEANKTDLLIESIAADDAETNFSNLSRINFSRDISSARSMQCTSKTFTPTIFFQRNLFFPDSQQEH